MVPLLLILLLVEHCGKASSIAKVMVVVTHSLSIGGDRNEQGLLENGQIVNIFENIKSEFQ